MVSHKYRIKINGDEFLFVVLYADPFVVEFINTAYTVLESVGQVEVCVNLTQPQRDILDETITINVYDDPLSLYIPSTAILASKSIYIVYVHIYVLSHYITHNFTAPDSPNLFGHYSRAPMTDYEQQTQITNHMRVIPITQTSRVVCYKQIVYDDRQVEPMEYISLSMNIRDSTVLTTVNPTYGQTAIKIIDNNDSKLSSFQSAHCTPTTIYTVLLLCVSSVYTVAVVCLENTVYHDTDSDGIVEVCVVVDEPNIDCPITFPFNVTLSTSDGKFNVGCLLNSA